ncbi:MAG TPA: ABC transporter ATP-binding protein [Sedimentisphaerales bacterium]|nr:ABC transporter ATP-binding protein [Sedimentisphaerales bacterium]
MSRFYGEVLGVNRVTLSLAPGITSLVGPNGAGKTTLMNLMTGLLRPTRGRIRVLGIAPTQSHKLFGLVGYATQFDAFPKGLSGFQFIYSYLRLFGYSNAKCKQLANKVIEQVGLSDAAGRRVAGYSKGMRQRIRLAQALAHDPRVLILDEPLNGLDPLVRAETIKLFRRYATEGRHVLVSSHVLHEVDMISDQVVLMSGGYVVAEGQIQGVRSEIQERPVKILIHCKQPSILASRAFEHEHVVEAQLLTEGSGVLITTRDADRFYRLLNHLAVNGIDIEGVTPADDNVNSVYDYLIGSEEKMSL